MSTNTKDIAGQSDQPVKLQPLRTPTTSASFLKVKVKSHESESTIGFVLYCVFINSGGV